MKRSRIWLLLAVALFAVAAWLMRGKSPAPPRKPPGESAFPRHMRSNESRRLADREVPFPARPDAGEVARRRDPFLAGLPPRSPGKTSVVVEVAAMKEMPVGRMFLKCLKKDGEDDKLQKKLGVGPDAVERVAVSDDVTIIAGKFDSLAWETAFPGVRPERYGPVAMIYESTDPADHSRRHVAADYDHRYIIYGRERSAVEAAIDRMEGQEDPRHAAIDDGDAYGEIYGLVGVDRIAEILQREEPDLADRLRSAADKIEMHVDATGDVLMVADVTGDDGTAVGDLGKAMGGALSVGRMGAKARDDDKLAELLETARVRPRGDSFGVEVALPLDLIEKSLGPCAKGWNDPAAP